MTIDLDLIKKITGLLALIGIIFSTFFFIDSRYTHEPVFTKAIAGLNKTISVIELKRQLRQAEDDTAYYRKKTREYPSDQDFIDKLKKSKDRLKRLEQLVEKAEKV